MVLGCCICGFMRFCKVFVCKVFTRFRAQEWAFQSKFGILHVSKIMVSGHRMNTSLYPFFNSAGCGI